MTFSILQSRYLSLVGELNTYWLQTTASSKGGSERSESSGDSHSISEDEELDVDEGVQAEKVAVKVTKCSSGKTDRLIEWNVDVLLRLLQQIVARREVTFNVFEIEDDPRAKVTRPFEEVKEIISLPELREARKHVNQNAAEIPESVVVQLRDYVSMIAGLYNENAFHNFEHVSFSYRLQSF